MDYMDRYILKSLNMLGRTLNGVARVNLTHYKQFLFVTGVLGAIVWLQNKEIHRLQHRINNIEDDIYDLQYANNPEKVE